MGIQGRQRRKRDLHQRRQFGAIGQAQILPEMVTAGTTKSHDPCQPEFGFLLPAAVLQEQFDQVGKFRDIFPAAPLQTQGSPWKIIVPKPAKDIRRKPQIGGKHAFIERTPGQEARQDGAQRIGRGRGCRWSVQQLCHQVGPTFSGWSHVVLRKITCTSFAGAA